MKSQNLGKKFGNLIIWTTLVIILGVINSQTTACSDFEFECGTGECIRSLYRCDLDRDCIDGSDEEECDDVSCTDDLFRCSSGRCIPKSFICDTDVDCDDGKDEDNCTSVHYNSTNNSPNLSTTTEVPHSCESWQFQCKSGSCIRASYQCDDDKDCSDGSDEAGCEPCVTTSKLEVGKPPFCKVRVFKGTTRIRNETQCGHNDVFRIKPGRIVPYDRRSYTEAKVNYVRINCEAYNPVDFRFEGVGAIEQIRVQRSQKANIPIIHITEVTTVVTPQATGNYIFREINTNATTSLKNTSLFFYFEKDKKPFLLGRDRTQKAKRYDNDTIQLPCVSSRANVSVYLFQELNSLWSRVDSAKYQYDPKSGFILNITQLEARQFKCTTDQSFTSDVDVVTIVVEDDVLAPTIIPRPSNLKIILGPGLSATCHTIRPQRVPSTTLEFTNVYADNPLDARVVADCVLKKSPTCGSYSHIRHHHPTSDDVTCRQDGGKTKCRHISEIYNQGVLICQTDTESLVQTYFTGLDDILYKDWRDAPKSALIKLDTLAANRTAVSGSSLTTKCAAVGMVFGRSSIYFESRYAGSDFVSKHANGGYQSWSFTLRENMTELLCSDHIWETVEEIWSDPVSINVTRRVITCGSLEYKCDSGQCIRATFRCDGDRDCYDWSDERNCPSTTSTTQNPTTCGPTEFHCFKGIRYTAYGSRHCVPATYKCDGDRDCAYGEDEDNCPSTTTTTSTPTPAPSACGPTMFECNNGDCIRASYKCDLAPDCKDKSDEAPIANCSTIYNVTVSSTTTTTTTTTTQLPLAILPEDKYEESGDLAFSGPSNTAGEKLPKVDHTSEYLAEKPAGTSALNITLIVLGVVFLLIGCGIAGIVVWRRYTLPYGNRGTSSSSNIKYMNPTCDQEEVLIS